MKQFRRSSRIQATSNSSRNPWGGFGCKSGGGDGILEAEGVNFRVLSDFRKDHGDFFQACFKQTVKLASLGHISLDGSKPVLSGAEGFKANSSKHKAMSYGRLKEKESEAYRFDLARRHPIPLNALAVATP
jgi:hypothetical protein